MARKDHYYNKSKQEGYRSRSAYKLKQIDDQTSILSSGKSIVDLGAAPGGWLQVAVEKGGEPIIGVDRQRIKPINDVILIRGDITLQETREKIREQLRAESSESLNVSQEPQVDVVLSDMAPNMTGEYSLDHARSIHLGRQAADIALELLRSGGDFVAKVFDGPDLPGFRSELEREFDYVRLIRPDATRDESSEVFLVGKHRLTAPVHVGDEVTVSVDDIGSQGDGVAKIEGFTLFVPEVEVGEEVTVRVTDVKPKFGFAEQVE